MINRCKCGCGIIIPEKDKRGRSRKFVIGHVNNIRNYKSLSIGVKQKISENKKSKNEIPWNKGLTKTTNEKIRLASIKTGLKNQGNNNPNMKKISLPRMNRNFAYILGCLCGDASIMSKKYFNTSFKKSTSLNIVFR